MKILELRIYYATAALYWHNRTAISHLR